MTEKQIIDELDSIISYCDVTKEKATGLRKKLALVEEGASPKGSKKKLSDEVIAKVLAGRQKHLNKKAIAANNGGY